jgi:hypothetical protein
MPTRASERPKDRDINRNAFLTVMQATGSLPRPEPEPDTRNPAAVALGKLGAAKGGKARAEKLSARLKRIQCDEIWEFVYAKAKNVPEGHAGEWGYGDVWTWVAIDAETKLVPSWAVGRRDGFMAQAFIRDLADRFATRVQLTRDGHKVYLEAVEGAFGANVDDAMLVKMYEGDSGKNAPAQTRYSPAACTGARSRRLRATPT